MGRSVIPKDYAAIGQQYAEDVVSEKIPACKWVRYACQRQLDDRKRKDFGWDWKPDRANHICKFIEKLPHIKGRWKSPTITLEPHQCFRLTTIFGWIDTEGYRRFRKALVVLPRKNGKTTEAAGVGLYCLALDGEPGAEVYAVAVNRDQVTGPSGVWTVARKIVERSEPLRNRYGVEALAHSIVIDADGSSFKPGSRDSGPQEGYNTHCAIIDELHAHSVREVFDVIDESTGARKQPLIYIISTEGDDGTGVFAEQVAYGQGVLSGNHEDDSYFAIFYTCDPEDDWTTPEAWRKANPNLGVSVFEKDLEIRCRQAQKNADSQSSFLTKRLNIRVGAGNAYFNMLAWNTICKDESLRIEDFAGQQCNITLDLASKRDLTTKVSVFRRGATYYVFGKHYLPEDAIEAGRPNYDFYRGWASKNLLTLTPGNVTDYEFLERDLLEDMQNYKPSRVGVDPNYNAAQFTTRMLAAGVPMVDVPQNVTFLSEPMKSLDALVVAGRIKHNGDPVLAWAMGNVIAKLDAKDNVYPRKARSENKIDPAVALIGNIGLFLREVHAVSVYANAESAAI